MYEQVLLKCGVWGVGCEWMCVRYREAWFGHHVPLWCKALVSALLLPAGASLALMSPWCKRWTRWLVEPDCGWLLWAPQRGMAGDATARR